MRVLAQRPPRSASCVGVSRHDRVPSYEDAVGVAWLGRNGPGGVAASGAGMYAAVAVMMWPVAPGSLGHAQSCLTSCFNDEIRMLLVISWPCGRTETPGERRLPAGDKAGGGPDRLPTIGGSQRREGPLEGGHLVVARILARRWGRDGGGIVCGCHVGRKRCRTS